MFNDRRFDLSDSIANILVAGVTGVTRQIPVHIFLIKILQLSSKPPKNIILASFYSTKVATALPFLRISF